MISPTHLRPSSMASAFSILIIFISSTIILCCARGTSYNADIAKQQAQRLIRSFNLSPEKSFNFVHDNESEPARLVEKPFKFPGLVDPSAVPETQLGHHAGYYPVKNSYGAKMFYFFFESRGSTEDPVVLWLTGGPGCGSELALFYENGPFQINDDLTLKWNDFGWDKVSNLLYVDQPTGTGFSYTSDVRDKRHNEAGVGNDLYDFLQAFFKGHPEFINNDFYITGESYAGHYIPVLASRVYKGNKNKEGIHINLKGFAIGNGLTNSVYQYPSYTDYALAHKLISKADYKEIKKLIPECVDDAKQCQSDDDACFNALSSCNTIFNEVLLITDNINYYDIRKKCEGELCYDFSNLEMFMNLDPVRKALGVGNREYVSCSQDVYYAMEGDITKSYDKIIPPLLEKEINVLIYAGEYDLICNWLGNLRWLDAIKWSGHKSFAAANLTSYIVDGKEAGLIKRSGPLTFLKVHDAGHLVPMDQPNVSLQMIKRWIAASKSKRLP